MKDAVRRFILEAQAGSNEALEELKIKYTPLLEGSVGRFVREGMSSQDKEDIRQEALINFFNAVYSYDLSMEGIEFGLYAKICVENSLVSFMRSFERRNRIPQISLDSISSTEDKKAARDMLCVIADREQALLLAKRISESLSEYENKIWWMYVSGLSVREIAASIDAEPKSVSNAVFRIRRKLREMMSSSSD